MALINCPECGGKISDKAPACIHCGFPLSEMTNLNESKLTSDSTENINDREKETVQSNRVPEVEEPKKMCINCGSRVLQRYNQCPNCGYDFITDTPYESSSINRNSMTGNGSTFTSPNPHINRISTTGNGSLIPCPSCGNLVSSTARTCPTCGGAVDTRVYCPKCGSSDTKPISGAGKATSIAVWGVFAANKVISKYQCKKCGHKF